MKKSPYKKLLKKSLWTLFFGCALIVTGSIIFYYSVKGGVFGKIPTVEELNTIKNAEASEVYSADGVLLGRYYKENRTNAKFEHIAPHVINALIATEDARFYEHEGVDRRSLLRVIVKSILMGDKSAGGGSTISQQLIKNLYGRERHGILTMPVNKVKEAIVALRLEESYSKNDILQLYLNTVSFGENTYGIETACRRFFNTSTDSISIQDGAVLIGMLKAPTSYNPRINPEKSLTRRNTVLAQMEKYGYLEHSDKEQLTKLPITLNYNRISTHTGLAPYFREFLRVELEKWIKDKLKSDGTPYDLFTDGLTIRTTIDSRMQKYAEEAVNEHLASLQVEFNKDLKKHDKIKNSSSIVQNGWKRSPLRKQLLAQGWSDERLNEFASAKKSMEIYTHRDPQKIVEFSMLDSIQHYLSFLHAGFLAIEPSNGNVLAWVGGIDHEHFQFDHVTTHRQVGSTFKPIVYANAIERGISPCKYIKNERVVYEEYDNWSPRNANGIYEGFYSVKGGLTHSVNTISVQLIMEGGINETIDLARKLGISVALPDGPAIALGTGNISLYEMLGAYTAFANEGIYTKPRYVTEVLDHKTILYEGEGYQQQVLKKETALIMTDLMQSVVKNGTARRLAGTYNINHSIAGKTGTTQSHTDGWFIGFTPSLLAGAWVGADNPQLRFSSGKLGQGANMALPIWALFWKKAASDPMTSHFCKESFPDLPLHLSAKLGCELYVDHKPGLLNALFNRHKQRSNEAGKPSGGFKKLFGRKKKR